MSSSENSLKQPIKLLITARDPATAVSFQKLIPELKNDCRFSIYIVAQSPAYEILKEVDSDVEPFLPEKSFELKQKKIAELMRNFHPQAVLCGISGPDLGVDEATLKVAQDRSIPSYALQNFWGDMNQLSGATPDHAFVLDDEAIILTQNRYPGVRCTPIGSIKHADFSQYNALEIRKAKRERLLNQGEILIGFYGQPILEIEGYFETIEAMTRQLKLWQKPFKLLYRPHPKESEELFVKTKTLFQQAFADNLSIDNEKEIVNSLCACDLVVSAFSTCGFDNLYLNEISAEPFNCSIYLWFEPNLIQWWRDYSGLSQMPLVEEGLLLSPESENEILSIFDKGLKSSTQKELWHRAKQHLPDASLSIGTLINTLVEDLNEFV